LYRESVGRAEPPIFEAWADLLQLHVGRVLRTTMHQDVLWPIGNAVSADLRRRWTVEEMAASAGISGEHLRRLCWQQFGCSPMQHVMRLRMRHAGALLQATPQKIDTIAQMVGYTSRFSFSAAFKRCMGVTPCQYRGQGK
jgi:AraC-like DNA-binding protein